MTTNEIEVRPGSGLDIGQAQEYWTPRQLAALQQLGVQDATPGDLTVFFHQCQRTGLDPFARQIYMIGRNTKNQRTQQWEVKYTIQTGIDGFRLVARRAADLARETVEYEDTLWSDPDGNWRDVWLADGPPAAAKVVVVRDGKRYPATVMFREYVQTTKEGNPTQMWREKPALMLAKCAEALALRRAFPQDLAGLHTADEYRDDPPAPAPRRVTAAEIRRDTEPEPDPVTGEVQTEPTGYADPTAPPGPEPWPDVEAKT